MRGARDFNDPRKFETNILSVMDFSAQELIIHTSILFFAIMAYKTMAYKTEDSFQPTFSVSSTIIKCIWVQSPKVSSGPHFRNVDIKSTPSGCRGEWFRALLRGPRGRRRQPAPTITQGLRRCYQLFVVVVERHQASAGGKWKTRARGSWRRNLAWNGTFLRSSWRNFWGYLCW